MRRSTGAAWGPGWAQPSNPKARTETPAPARLTPADRDTALNAITAALQKSYVLPERRTAVLERLSQSRKAGRYDVDSPSLLVERVTDDLKSASGDLHLYLQHDPARYAAAEGAGRRHRRVLAPACPARTPRPDRDADAGGQRPLPEDFGLPLDPG
ncbi:MAG: hypothetical protein EOO71_04610 [Myxococcaceae bacterium]|nr:MAG: hypothetical protein EOO71_04610 [Myxococcaceae bacterium]